MNGIRDIVFAEYGVTIVHPLAIVFMLCMAALAFAPKRSWVVLALISVCAFMPMDQRVVIGGVDFSMLRLIMIVAWVRVLVRREYRGLRFGTLDRVVVLWILSASLFFVLRVGPNGIVNRLGVMFDGLSAFFLIRAFVRTRVDVLALWRQVAWVVLVLCPFMIYEAISEHNVFGIFRLGGWDLAVVRDGRVRATGPFSHPILAGTFGSAAIPAFMAIAFSRKKERKFYVAASIAATIIAFASASSGAVIAWGVGVLGWGMWRIRRHMRKIIWSAVAVAAVLHIAREKPVWHLMSRVSTLIGGSGNHRYRLIDAFIGNFGEWALVGTDGTRYWGWGLQDVTNEYVAQGVKGGIVTLVLFIVVLRVSFVQLRRSRAVFERLEGPTSLWALLAWGSSVSLAAHCVSFMSVSYFGRMFQFFVFFVATIPAFARFRRPRRVKSSVAPRPANAQAPMPATGFRSIH